MPRITTSQTSKATVAELARVAKKNRRTPAREALIAIETYIFSEISKANPAKS